MLTYLAPCTLACILFILYTLCFPDLFFKKSKRKKIKRKPNHLVLCSLVFACVVKIEKLIILLKFKNCICVLTLGK